MQRFEYEVRQYPAEQFLELAYFCSEKGECSREQLTTDQIRKFQDLLNERGAEGWELVQVFFGQDGVVGLWKRSLSDRETENI